MGRGANVLTIGAEAPFGETLARGLIARLGHSSDPLALSAVTIYLPTRRAARGFGDVFAELLGGAALLPEFKALGDADEDELLFDPYAEELNLPPAISRARRRLLLATLIGAWDKQRRKGDLNFAQCVGLADGLASVMDEVETQGADLSALESLAPAGLAEHWAETVEFLSLLRVEWPKLLEAEGAANPAKRRNKAILALARRLSSHPPQTPVIAAGSTGSIPATAELLSTIARLPQGAVVLQGLDRELDDESWEQLDPGHPQYGFKQLLQKMDVARADVKDWTGQTLRPPRSKLWSAVLRPAPTTDAWRVLVTEQKETLAQGLSGVSMLKAADPAQEALCIALALRENLEREGATAALVTPDRTLSRRVAAELRRWDIEIDDSAGQPLAHTETGSFLCLLAEAADQEFAPVVLLALLKHPLAVFGAEAGAFPRFVHMLDRMVLRGPRPDRGLAGIAKAIAARIHESKDENHSARLIELQTWFAGLRDVLGPFERARAKTRVILTETLDAHIAAAEALADTQKLWRGEAGEAAAQLIAELSEAALGLPEVEPRSYAPLFSSLALEKPVRPAYGRHPRLAILGPLEARLQSFDLVVLGGLNEGAWPRTPAADPWFSRPMRKSLHLEQPERSIGLAAHDFATLAAAPRVLLTRALKADGVPTVASRWLQRLTQLTSGAQLFEMLTPSTPYLSIVEALSKAEPAPRIAPPRPRPPVHLRPRNLSVTEIETWLRDPYAIYAKHVLRLRPLDPLQGEVGALERGQAVHLALERFVREFPHAMPANAELRFIEIANETFAELAMPKSVLALWRPRIIQAARWFVGEERRRRVNIAASHVEIKGEIVLDGPGGEFRLRGRADRIDVLSNGGAAILDYKTGAPPTLPQVKQLLCPQLPLEAAMVAAGGFADVRAAEPAELIYVRFSGGADDKPIEPLNVNAREIADEALTKLKARIAQFDQETTPYPSRVRPYRANAAGDYDHLARVAEWSTAGWQEGE